MWVFSYIKVVEISFSVIFNEEMHALLWPIWFHPNTFCQDFCARQFAVLDSQVDSFIYSAQPV